MNLSTLINSWVKGMNENPNATTYAERQLRPDWVLAQLSKLSYNNLDHLEAELYRQCETIALKLDVEMP